MRRRRSQGRSTRSVLTWLARSKNAIPVLIAAVSIIGSVMSWRAALATDAAAGLEERATREVLEVGHRAAELDRRVDQDLRLLPRYEEHILAWRLGRSDGDPIAAERARGELALARALRPFFLGVGLNLDFGDEEGTVVYDPQFVADQLRRLDQPLNELRAKDSGPRAEAARRRSSRLEWITVLAVSTLIPLTAARFARAPALRARLAGAAALVAAVSLTMFVLIDLAA